MADAIAEEKALRRFLLLVKPASMQANDGEGHTPLPFLLGDCHSNGGHGSFCGVSDPD